MLTLSGYAIIVDDDHGVRNSLKFALQAHGLAVDVYKSGSDLLSQDRFPPDACFVLDYMMPAIDGIELLRRLRERQVDSPALLVTPQASPQLREQARQSGFRAVVEKPFEDGHLLDSIRSALEVR